MCVDLLVLGQYRNLLRFLYLMYCLPLLSADNMVLQHRRFRRNQVVNRLREEVLPSLRMDAPDFAHACLHQAISFALF